MQEPPREAERDKGGLEATERNRGAQERREHHFPQKYYRLWNILVFLPLLQFYYKRVKKDYDSILNKLRNDFDGGAAAAAAAAAAAERRKAKSASS